jgi:hypothetical protein
VTLTVTDDDGAIGSTTQTITVTGRRWRPTLAADGFGRTVASGFGTADLGGAWGFSGSGTTASVADGSGRASLPAGRTALLRLGSVSNLDTDVTPRRVDRGDAHRRWRVPEHDRARRTGRGLSRARQDHVRRGGDGGLRPRRRHDETAVGTAPTVSA